MAPIEGPGAPGRQDNGAADKPDPAPLVRRVGDEEGAGVVGRQPAHYQMALKCDADLVGLGDKATDDVLAKDRRLTLGVYVSGPGFDFETPADEFTKPLRRLGHQCLDEIVLVEPAPGGQGPGPVLLGPAAVPGPREAAAAKEGGGAAAGPRLADDLDVHALTAGGDGRREPGGARSDDPDICTENFHGLPRGSGCAASRAR